MKQIFSIIVFSLILACETEAQPLIATVAGTGSAGYSGDNGPATAARLDAPCAVFVDRDNNIFIADQFNNIIRKVNAATQVITTVAGTGTSGYSGDNGNATSAELSWPADVFVDTAGNIFIADGFNHVIRKVIAATNTIVTIAGTGVSGYTGNGGPATAAQLAIPNGIYGDSLGNIYFSEYGNSIVRKIDGSTGTLSVVAGTGTAGSSPDNIPATMAGLDHPAGIYIDDHLNLYIADVMSHRVRKVSAATGIITTLAGTGASGYGGDDAPATDAQLSNPADVFVDGAGDILIADVSNSRIRKVNGATGVITTVAGDGTAGYSGDGFPAANAQLKAPSGVQSNSSGEFYIADGGNNAIRKVARDLTAVNNRRVEKFSVYPNPAHGLINIVSSEGGDCQVTVMDVLGRQVLNRRIHGRLNQFDVSELQSGSYCVCITRNSSETIVQIAIGEKR